MRGLRVFSILTLVGVLVLASGCSPGKYAELEKSLKQNQQKWTSQKITDYTFTVQIGCFCPEEIRAPAVSIVRGGQVVSLKYAADNRDVTNELIKQVDTIDELFGKIREAIDNQVHKLTVEYDATLGYPKQISIDPIETAIDEERGYTVLSFSR